jgi:hypothetical protein
MNANWVVDVPIARGLHNPDARYIRVTSLHREILERLAPDGAGALKPCLL